MAAFFLVYTGMAFADEVNVDGLEVSGTFTINAQLASEDDTFDRNAAVTTLYDYLIDMNKDIDPNEADEYAKAQVDQVIMQMDAAQDSVQEAYDELEDRVKAMNDDNPKKEKAEKLLETAEDSVKEFTKMDAEYPDEDSGDLPSSDHLFLNIPVGGVMPTVTPDDAFTIAQANATRDMSAVNQILIIPDRPGGVPEGNLIGDFIPQFVRQLFRFAWLAVLIALTVSGIMFIMAFDSEERLTKAKHMIYYSLIGFAIVALSFALVKAVTDIDFFRFI